MDQKTLNKLIDYCPKTGRMVWRERDTEWFSDGKSRTAQHKANNWNACFAGKPAISAVSKDGYLRGAVLGKSVTAHRIAWVICKGTSPEMVDHINGDRSDNRIENLRGVNATENNRNLKARSANFGICFDKSRKKWMAHIGNGGKMKNLGRFDTKEDAITARQLAMIELGYHENHGRVEAE